VTRAIPTPASSPASTDPASSAGSIDETEDRNVFRGASPEPVRDVIDGVGEVREQACDLPLGPLFPGGPIAEEVVC
jgi:hypothetical protein